MLEEASFSIERTGQHVVVCGELDLATASQLERALAELTGDVIVDCQDVSFLDSTALSVLVRAHNRLEAEQGHLTIKGLSERCRRVFEVSGVDQALHLS
ncbi:MAG TPA: STAS domain-containing protein [Acidimicrobiia bacterium]|nr:STAS domain-containing protein [Acidimicrobiia bacterium]